MSALARNAAPEPLANPLLDAAQAIHYGRDPDHTIACVRRGLPDRNALVRLYSFAIPTTYAIKLCAKYGPIVEMGAGTGYWASLITKMGGDVIAYDDGSWGYTERYHDVRHGTPETLAQHADRTLFLCWPPYDDSFARACLDHFRGDHLIYVGEGYGGCTADDEFHERLGAEWEHIDGYPIPQWVGVYDSLSVWRRK